MNRMNRRRFLIFGAEALGASLIAPPLLGGEAPLAEQARAQAQDSYPDLTVAKGEPREAVSRALKAIGGITRFLKPNGVVLIKPNASFATPPEWGVTTHPEVLTAVLEACFAAGARRAIVADHTMGNAERCFKRTGTTEAVARFEKAKLISLDQQRLYRETEVPAGKSLHKTEVASIVAKADLFINLPTAKCHNATEVGLGLKNLMGLVWDRNTFHNDMDIHVGIADLATAVKPHLTILDAMHVLKTNGPTGPGEVHHLGIVVAGTDAVAVDAYGVGLSTWNGQTLQPAHVKYLRLAAEHGVGTLDLKALKIVERT